MNLKSLTENRYTLNDIFVKNSEGWLVTAFLLFPLAQLVHILVFTFTFNNELSADEFLAVMISGQFPGDYFVVILYTFFPLIIIIGLAGVAAKCVSVIKSKNGNMTEIIPLMLLFVFSALVIVSTIVNKTDKRSIVGNLSITGEGALSFPLYVIFFWIGTSIRKENSKYNIIYSILGLGLVNGIITLVDKFIVEIPIVSNFPLCAIYYNINFYAYFLTIVIMLSAALVLKEKNKGRKAFAFISLCMNSFVLALNNTFGCFVACFVAFIIMIIADLVIRKKFSFAALGIFGVFLAICMITSLFVESFFTQILGLFTDLRLILTDDENADNAGTLRWGLWVNTVKLIKKKPWIGYGYEGFSPLLREATDQGKVHNEYLEHTAAFGIPAGMLYVASLIYVYIKAFIKREKIDGATFCALVAAFGYIGSAFFGNSKIYITPFFFTLLGFGNAISSEPDVIPSVAEESTETEADESEILRLASLAQDDTNCHSEPAEESGADEVEETGPAEESGANEIEETEETGPAEESQILRLAPLAQDDNNVATPQDDNVCHSEPIE